MRNRQQILSQLKEQLKKAQDRMKRFADEKRIERSFSVGYWVFFKIQPYRQITLAGNRNPKLSSKYYGPFEITDRIGEEAYRLNLPGVFNSSCFSCLTVKS